MKVSVVIGRDVAGGFSCLYVGAEAGPALEALKNAPKDLATVAAFRLNRHLVWKKRKGQPARPEASNATEGNEGNEGTKGLPTAQAVVDQRGVSVNDELDYAARVEAALSRPVQGNGSDGTDRTDGTVSVSATSDVSADLASGEPEEIEDDSEAALSDKPARGKPAKAKGGKK